jgi:hypothetical protein
MKKVCHIYHSCRVHYLSYHPSSPNNRPGTIHRPSQKYSRTPHLGFRRPHPLSLVPIPFLRHIRHQYPKNKTTRTVDGTPAPDLACCVFAGWSMGSVCRLGRRCTCVGGTHGKVRGDSQGTCGGCVQIGMECGWENVGQCEQG